jgi:hypothetical protein
MDDGVTSRLESDHTPSQIHRVNLSAVPLTLPQANRCITAWHRHHGQLPGGFGWYCIGAVCEGRLVAATICGRPTNRNNDDRQTVEVLRLASDGTPNTCSFLLGRAARIAKLLGAHRIITYTLSEEGGASLRAANWECEKEGIQSWWMHEGVRPGARARDHMAKHKIRWAQHFGEPTPPYAEPATTDPQTSLDATGDLWG